MFKDDYRVLCPFYKRYKEMKIVCEGVNGRTNLELAFTHEKYERDYVKEFCAGNYKECMIYQMLKAKYE